MKTTKRVLHGLIALFMVLTLIAAPLTARAAKTEVVNPSTDCCGDDWSWTGDSDKIATLPYGEITADEVYVAGICTPYWADYKYSTEPTDTPVTFTAGDGLVSIALRVRNEDAIWGGAEVLFAEITPTAAGEAITSDTTVSGTFTMFYASWGANCEVPFSILLKPGASANQGGETQSGQGGQTSNGKEVVSDSLDACGDDWSWTGDGDKIATLPAGEINPDETFVAAVCTPYWCDNKYTGTPTETTVSFSSGDGLVTIALRLRNEDVIWGGADVVFAEITPTAAAASLTEDTTVSGTFQMFYAAWGANCEVPFRVVIKAASTGEAGTGGGAETGDNGFLPWVILGAAGVAGTAVLLKKKYSLKAE